MRMRLKIILPVLLSLTALISISYFFMNHPPAVLNPAGIIARQQRDLLIITLLLMLLIVLPVFGLTFYIAWKYRATNSAADYQPDWDRNIKLETAWWGFPTLIIFVLALITWTSSHQLDPSRPIASTKQPLNVQVIALQWKWLFVYPEQQIATINRLQIPVGRPVNFEITSDAPMNSFWIPQLGGQIYAMSGMSSKLHLMADNPGIYNGSSANISGEGFADMKFKTHATSDADFDAWVRTSKTSNTNLDWATYQRLAVPQRGTDQTVFASYERNLYDKVIAKYMAHDSNKRTTINSHNNLLNGNEHE